MVIVETNDDEENSEDGEARKLDWLTADSINGCNGNPITWDGTGANNDQVADSCVAEDMVDIAALGIANSAQDDGVVETEAVESDIEEEPGASSSEEDLPVSPLTVVAPEIGP